MQLEETTLQQMIDSQTAVPAQACLDAAGYDTSDHLPAVLAEFTVEDVLWPMPFNVSGPVLYFDANDFREEFFNSEQPSDPNSNPDFSATAPPLRFGFGQMYGLWGDVVGVNTKTGIDNFSLQIVHELPTLSNTNSPDRPYGLRIAEIEVD